MVKSVSDTDDMLIWSIMITIQATVNDFKGITHQYRCFLALFQFSVITKIKVHPEPVNRKLMCDQTQS